MTPSTSDFVRPVPPLNYDPEAGFVLFSGHFTATYQANGTVIENLNGTGQIATVWDELL